MTAGDDVPAPPSMTDPAVLEELCDHVGDCGHKQSGWVRRGRPARHVCGPPMREVVYRVPRGPSGVTPPDGYEPPPDRPEPKPHREMVPDGGVGDLWRCPCRRLWRIGDACDACDAWGAPRPHRGMCRVGRAWRPAFVWQVLRHLFDRGGPPPPAGSGSRGAHVVDSPGLPAGYVPPSASLIPHPQDVGPVLCAVCSRPAVPGGVLCAACGAAR
jgi:hypothetical protein